MEGLGEDIVSLLRYLTPGFLAAWIFYGLTPHPVPSQFERTIQALIFTFINEATVNIIITGYRIASTKLPLASWNDEHRLIVSALNSVLVELGASCFANNDAIHRFLRKIRLTNETSYPSEWFGVFANKKVYVVLHLADDRRIYGWPREWPSDPNEGHFSLEQASWLSDENEETKLTNVSAMLVNVRDVKFVEFVEQPERA